MTVVGALLGCFLGYLFVHLFMCAYDALSILIVPFESPLIRVIIRAPDRFASIPKQWQDGIAEVHETTERVMIHCFAACIPAYIWETQKVTTICVCVPSRMF